MSLKPCRNGGQLPPLMSCGDVCNEWPDCLPAPSPDSLEGITRFCAEEEAADHSSEAVARALSRLYDAITRGLEERDR
jgi:hypothetical protein